MIMYDFCCGHKTASAAAMNNGWTVITLDVEEKFSPDILMDIRDYHFTGERPDLMWFSPPCDEFAREFMPWSKTGKTPDMSVYQACLRIIGEAMPRYWVIENVKGAIRYFGKPRAIFSGICLWGDFPDIGKPVIRKRNKESMSSSWSEQRAFIPYALSRALITSVEVQEKLLEAE